ncbi:MAG TPA: cytochrome P450 [Actinocrinis sp.]|nr:cytochrome P450 [Actinocrinis sp.]
MPPRTGHTVPGPKGQFLIGNAPHFERDPIAWLTRTRDEFGDIVRITPDTIVIHHPDDVQRLLLMTNTDFAMDKAPRAHTSRQRDHEARQAGWLEENPYAWRIFTRPTVAGHLDRIARQIARQLSLEANTDRDIFTGARRVCGHAIADYLLGRDDRTGDIAEDASSTAQAEARLNEHPESRWVFGPGRRSRSVSSDNARQLDTIHGIVARRKTQGVPGGQPDALDTLLSEFPRIPDSVAAAIVRDGLAAGHSAPGTALTWLMLRLARHPECAKRIREESEGFDLENGAPGDIHRLLSSYADAFVREVLRLHPPHWMIGRRTTRKVTVRGYEIAPGQTVLCIPYLIHRDPRWWPDPEEFDPDRWLRERVPYSGCAYIPFGHGPRMCPGRFMGQTELVLAAMLLATKYSLELPSVETVEVSFRSLLLPENLKGGWYEVADDW